MVSTAGPASRPPGPGGDQPGLSQPHRDSPLVLIGYATADGSTPGIAERIARVLQDRGIQTNVLALNSVGDAAQYDAAVLGSAIHDQRWLVPASRFLHGRAVSLAGRPVWMFSVSSVGDEESFFGERTARVMRRFRNEPADVAFARSILDVRGHRNFAGVISPAQWPLSGRLFFCICRGRYGDHRNWAAVEAWAHQIAATVLEVQMSRP